MDWLKLRTFKVRDWVELVVIWVPLVLLVAVCMFVNHWINTGVGHFGAEEGWYVVSMIIFFATTSAMLFFVELPVMEEWLRFLLLSIVSIAFALIGCVTWLLVGDALNISGEGVLVMLSIPAVSISVGLIFRRFLWPVLLFWFAIPWIGAVVLKGGSLGPAWYSSSVFLVSLIAFMLQSGALLGILRVWLSLVRANPPGTR